MRSQHHRSSLYGAIAAVLLSGGVAAAPAAAAEPAQVGPHQVFHGEVNGASARAVIQVVCPGPVGPGRTGHPAPGQSVDIVLVTAPDDKTLGYTGESAEAVLVGFGPTSAALPLRLDHYGVKAEIPGTQNLPCLGTGTVDFVPAPGSATARPHQVTVTYQNIAP